MPKRRKSPLKSAEKRPKAPTKEPERLEKRRERELKKLEDCWTKRNLEIQNSGEDGLCTRSRSKGTPTHSSKPSTPNTRSSTKADVSQIKILKECSKTPQFTAKNSPQSLCKVEDSPQNNLSQKTCKRQLFDDFKAKIQCFGAKESPVVKQLPGRVSKELHVDKNDDPKEESSVSASQNVSVQEENSLNSSKTVNVKVETTDSSSQNINVTENADVSSSNSTAEDKGSLNAAGADEDDDTPTKEMPHLKQFLQVTRKKLRSEVTNTELWEGFPVDIRMPRLKPIEITPPTCDTLVTKRKPKKTVTKIKDKRKLKQQMKFKSKSPFIIRLPAAKGTKPRDVTKARHSKCSNASESNPELPSLPEKEKKAVSRWKNLSVNKLKSSFSFTKIRAITQGIEKEKAVTGPRKSKSVTISHPLTPVKEIELLSQSASKQPCLPMVSEITIKHKTNVTEAASPNKQTGETGVNPPKTSLVKTRKEIEISDNTTNPPKASFDDTRKEPETGILCEESKSQAEPIIDTLDSNKKTAQDAAAVGLQMNFTEDSATNTLPLAGPISNKAQAGPISNKAQTGPISNKAQAGPISSKAQAGSISNKAQAGPISRKAQAGPISNKAQAGPISNKAQACSISNKAQAGPISNKAQAGPISNKAQAGPISNKDKQQEDPTSSGVDQKAETAKDEQKEPPKQNPAATETADKSPLSVKKKREGATKPTKPLSKKSSSPPKGNANNKVPKSKDKQKLVIKIKFKGNKNKKLSGRPPKDKNIPKRAEVVRNVADESEKKESQQIASPSISDKSPPRMTRLRTPQKKTDDMFVMLPTIRERRRSSVQDPRISQRLLKDTRLANYACLLWSSENRRRFQQEGLKNGESLDDVVRNEWERLTDREKMPYFERAHIATEHKNDLAKQDKEKEENAKNMHLNKKYTVPQFCALSSKQQDSWISNKLKSLQRSLDRDGYKVFLLRFNNAYAIAKKQRNVAGITFQENDQVLARTVLFECIVKAEMNLHDLIKERDSKRHFNVAVTFSKNIQSITFQNPVIVQTKPVVEPEETAVLCDIISAIVDVENQAAKVGSASSTTQPNIDSSPRFKKALKFLKHGSTTDTLMMTIGGEDWMLQSCPNREEYRRTLQAAVRAKTLPKLGLQDIESVLGF